MHSVPVLSLLSIASGALAGTIKYPEVIPGPGMPSLASLNLTSEQLYTMPMPDLSLRQAQITGGMDHASSSYCQDVAVGALDVIANCNSDRGVKGVSVAYGNGDINVGVNGLDCSTSD
ncbi:hypothetical protein NLG97_g3715 [Lecanicillium saksenae]|uniref:Uncharacterized protein n=1 Tax=Lecanicillium saksenae TaxID=468837 RepID=A0ACC1QXA9_9HYPO|nr:hypothetical protein NLG97_g3715 [Lecanicillium saksenae]